MFKTITLLIGGWLAMSSLLPAIEPSDEWIDPDTGHRIIKLSRLPGKSYIPYFHQNLFTQKGDAMIFTNVDPSNARRIYSIDLKTKTVRRVSDRDSSWTFFEQLAPKNRKVYYLSGNDICTADIDTGKNTVLATIPEEWNRGRGFAINSEETMLVGCAAIGEREFLKNNSFPDKVAMMEAVLKAKLPNLIYTVEIATGKINVIYRSTDWLGHVQFSPTDPSLLMFCHEGPSKLIDSRIWTIRLDGSGLRDIAPRKNEDDRLTHEFWSKDGKTIWFDWRHSQGNSVAGIDILSGNQTRYFFVNPGLWSFHYNISWSQKQFAGDGSPAADKQSQWIFLFTPNSKSSFSEEKLVNMAKHNYKLEPNVNFSPDDKWVVFQSNMSGEPQVYAVEIEKAPIVSKQ